MSTDRPIQNKPHRNHARDQNTSDRNRSYPGDVVRLNEYELVAVDEWLPGKEPAPYELEFTDDYEYRTRYLRCQNCGQERNRRDDFRTPCDEPEPPTPLEAGNYSIDEPRTRRALTENIDAYFTRPGPIYEVVSESTV